jgi:hypothetical protein
MLPRLMWFVSAVIVLTWAPVASAQLRSAAGIDGNVDEEDLSIYRFNDTGSVSIKSSVARGTLNVRFQVGEFTWVRQDGDCPELRANLRDTGSGARVIVRLMRLGIGGEAPVGELTSIAEIDTDASLIPPSTRYVTHRVCIPGDALAPVDFTYYIDAQLIKGNANGNPGLMSVQLCRSQDSCDP